MEEKFKDLLEELHAKRASVPGPMARRYAIMNTELEKVYAFYLVYVKEEEQNND